MNNVIVGLAEDQSKNDVSNPNIAAIYRNPERGREVSKQRITRIY